MIEPSKNRIKEGAMNWEEFWKIFIKNNATEDFIHYGFVNMSGEIIQENSLKSVFLGVKPAHVAQEINNIDFSKYKLQKHRRFIYDPILVKNIIKNNPDIFGPSPVNLEDIFDELSESNEEINPWSQEKLYAINMKTGLLMGFPKKSTEWFSKNTEKEEPKPYGYKNVCWVGGINEDPTEDKKDEDILRRAFQESKYLVAPRGIEPLLPG